MVAEEVETLRETEWEPGQGWCPCSIGIETGRGPGFLYRLSLFLELREMLEERSYSSSNLFYLKV